MKDLFLAFVSWLLLALAVCSMFASIKPPSDFGARLSLYLGIAAISAMIFIAVVYAVLSLSGEEPQDNTDAFSN